MRTIWKQPKRPSAGTRVTKELVERWKHTMFDVCGVGREVKTQVNREVFLTHTHNDHLPLAQVLASGITMRVAPPLLSRIQRIYGEKVVAEEYSDFVESKHTLMVNNRITTAPTFAYFIKDTVLIPESDNASELVEQYKAKYVFCFAFKQPRNHFGNAFNNRRGDVFILDNSVWSPYAPNIIPKITYALSDEEEFKRRMLQDRLYGRRIT